jgi:putative oxidoreductase
MLFPGLAEFSDWGLLVLRVAVGLVFIVHGWPKITGGKQAAEAMSGKPNPGFAAVITLQGIVETAGAALLALGVLTQLVAIAFIVIMLGAIALKVTRFKTGFMSQTTTGWELDLVLLAAAVLFLLAGPGELAIQG